jgi:hypothetical protein
MSNEPEKKFPVKLTPCAFCGESVPENELNESWHCTTCVALLSLKATLERVGKMHPGLWDKQREQLAAQIPPPRPVADNCLPPSDRNESNEPF